MVIKTKKSAFQKLSRVLSKHHPYDVPEIIGLPIDKGNISYLEWIAKEVKV